MCPLLNLFYSVGCALYCDEFVHFMDGRPSWDMNRWMGGTHASEEASGVGWMGGWIGLGVMWSEGRDGFVMP